MSTPNYVLTEPVPFSSGRMDTKILEAGVFVRPIEYCYVPKHVIEDSRWRWFNKSSDVFVYCHHGIIAVPKASIRRV